MQPVINMITSLKKEMQLTQQDIADYLGVSRSFIGAVESNLKSFSAKHLIKLSNLYIQFNKLETTYITTELAAQQNELNCFLQLQNNKQIYKKNKLQLQLAQIKNNYNVALQMLQTVRSLQVKATKKDLLWLNVVEAVAQQKLLQNGLIVQKKFEIRIEKI